MSKRVRKGTGRSLDFKSNRVMSWQFGVTVATTSTSFCLNELIGALIPTTSIGSEHARSNRKLRRNQTTTDGGGHSPKAISNCRAAARMLSSLHGLPANCTPTGNPSLVVEARTATTGQPVRLCAMV
jgi:hypothetical protein